MYLLKQHHHSVGNDEVQCSYTCEIPLKCGKVEYSSAKLMTVICVVQVVAEPLMHQTFTPQSGRMRDRSLKPSEFLTVSWEAFFRYTKPCVHTLTYLHATVTSSFAQVEHFWNSLLENVNESQVNATLVQVHKNVAVGSK